MALNLSVETPHGFSATYWKLIELRIDWILWRADVLVGGYKDADARAAGKNYVSRRYTWEGEEFPFTNGLENHTEVAYTKLKTLPEWAGAVDA